ncbi:uncharacterized protein LOC142567761 [Dermacentor variabilis]|uniref:uncharacterized protein LOC142567761 n=1 Tax=Dermacentor variabilis TaxID=34621 RepID=UPI003F5B9574
MALMKRWLSSTALQENSAGDREVSRRVREAPKNTPAATPQVPRPTTQVPRPTTQVPQPTPQVEQPTPQVPQPTPREPRAHRRQPRQQELDGAVVTATAAYVRQSQLEEARVQEDTRFRQQLLEQNRQHHEAHMQSLRQHHEAHMESLRRLGEEVAGMREVRVPRCPPRPPLLSGWRHSLTAPEPPEPVRSSHRRHVHARRARCMVQVVGRCCDEFAGCRRHKMPGCCVPLCSNHSRNGWRMFQFLRDPRRRRILWTARIKRDKWQPTNTSCICSAHFEEDSFEQNRADGWKKLKPNAVPTVFSFRPLPRHRKAPKDRTGPAVLSALLEDQHDIATDDHEAAMDPMSSPGRFELTQGQNCSPHDASSSALVTDEAGLQVSASGMNAGVSDLQSACTSCAELSK